MTPRPPTRRHAGAPPPPATTGAAAQRADVDSFASRPMEVTYEFVEVLGFDLAPDHRGGIVRVTGQIIDVPHGDNAHPGKGQSYEFASIDVRIIGLIGSSPTALHRASLGGDAGAVDFVLEHPSPYKRISVLARLLLNADPYERLAFTTKKPTASVGVQLRMAK